MVSVGHECDVAGQEQGDRLIFLQGGTAWGVNNVLGGEQVALLAEEATDRGLAALHAFNAAVHLEHDLVRGAGALDPPEPARAGDEQQEQQPSRPPARRRGCCGCWYWEVGALYR